MKFLINIHCRGTKFFVKINFPEQERGGGD